MLSSDLGLRRTKPRSSGKTSSLPRWLSGLRRKATNLFLCFGSARSCARRWAPWNAVDDPGTTEPRRTASGIDWDERFVVGSGTCSPSAKVRSPPTSRSTVGAVPTPTAQTHCGHSGAVRKAARRQTIFPAPSSARSGPRRSAIWAPLRYGLEGSGEGVCPSRSDVLWCDWRTEWPRAATIRFCSGRSCYPTSAFHRARSAARTAAATHCGHCGPRDRPPSACGRSMRWGRCSVSFIGAIMRLAFPPHRRARSMRSTSSGRLSCLPKPFFQTRQGLSRS